MDPIRIYGYLETARAKVFDWTRPLTPEQYLEPFPIGLGTLARTLTHIMICEYYYVERLGRREVPPYDRWPIQDEKPPEFAVLEAAWREQAARTRDELERIRDWSAPLRFTVERDGRRTEVSTTNGDMMTQLALHEVHHRSQAMNMLRRLGAPAEDIDYSYLMFERRQLPG